MVYLVDALCVHGKTLTSACLVCSDSSVGSDEADEVSSSPIKFTLVTRRGNKMHFSNLDVPVSDDLAAKYRQREEVRHSLHTQSAIGLLVVLETGYGVTEASIKSLLLT